MDLFLERKDSKITMADIQPFKAYRPRPDLAAQIASPPYDVLNSEEARQLAAENPLSFLHVVKAEIDLDPAVDVHSEQVYEKSAQNLHKLMENGQLIQDYEPCLYLYQQRMGNHVQCGLVAGASVAEYQNNLIKKHEFTRLEKENDRACHVEKLGANTGPAFLTYIASAKIDALVDEFRKNKPVYDFTSDDGISHTLWLIGSQQIDPFVEAFAEVSCMYVADGHHRSAAACRVCEKRKAANPNHTGKEQYNYFLSVIFPHNQMKILDYNRVVLDLNGLSSVEFIEKISANFQVEPAQAPSPDKKGTFGMFLEKQWYRLTAKPGTYPVNDPVKSLDVSILQDNLLEPVLAIDDPRTSTRIDFVGGIRGTAELEKRCENDAVAAFSMFPTSIEELMAIADAGQVMPPKSTWFEPKLRSGLIVKMLDE
ncbi:MAG: DUF1015 domain-containing protein [Sedimentisphaerales bacterium]|nr:DUF1015 domain-containing protein [Sedimentisphaerales bacterium]